MHRETTISREIKLLKSKFELLEKNRQFRSILQKSNVNSDFNEDQLNVSVNDGITSDYNRNRLSEQTGDASLSSQTDDKSSLRTSALPRTSGLRGARKNVRIKLSRLTSIKQLFADILDPLKARLISSRRRTNKVASVAINASKQSQQSSSQHVSQSATASTASTSSISSSTVANNSNSQQQADSQTKEQLSTINNN